MEEGDWRGAQLRLGAAFQKAPPSDGACPPTRRAKVPRTRRGEGAGPCPQTWGAPQVSSPAPHGASLHPMSHRPRNSLPDQLAQVMRNPRRCHFAGSSRSDSSPFARFGPAPAQFRRGTSFSPGRGRLLRAPVGLPAPLSTP